jgi:uncharacterized protein (DUF2141 family)
MESMKRRVSRSAGIVVGAHLAWGGVAAATLPASAALADSCYGADGPHLNVVVDGLRSTRGDVVVEIYPDDPKHFLGHQAQVNSVHAKLDRSPANVCLTVPGPGYYAVAVFHDENGDRKFNRNALGLPSEGFGLSNNPPIMLGAPSFRAVRFPVSSGDTTIHVRLRYLGR